ncbi:probable chromatin-remodeling complex ATPase chain [Lotus japonicus]|uniref:probable chromatin-remodeling complex ATPase chain n=1 Tax=Lotus japonicus TaxID=34305 RepID=UPI00258CB43E|nr:probable chromatin-remodeling complex ATPase chain [Lotus japonicus]
MDIMETTKAEQCIPPLLLAAQMPSCNQSYLFQGKMVLLDKLLSKLKERDSRALKFTQMTRLLDLIEDYLMFQGYQYSCIDDNTDGEHRKASMAVFVAINLATADIVIHVPCTGN